MPAVVVIVALKSGGKADGRRDGDHRVGAEKYQGTGDPRHRLRPFLTAQPHWSWWRLWLLDFDQGLVGPLGIVERGFELCRW